MKILLAQMNFQREPIQGLDDSYPLGLGYLDACLTQAGHNVTTISLAEHGAKEALQLLLSYIRAIDPGLIGFQMLTGNRVATLQAIRMIRREQPYVPIIVGGAHASACSRQIVYSQSDVMVLKGEAEESLVTLANALETGDSLTHVQGLVAMIDGRLVETPPPAEVDVDALPRLNHAPFLTMDDTMASMLTTRGCPFACSFCGVARRKMRLRSIESVLDEIEYLQESYPNLRIVRFFDDQMFFNIPRTIELCDGILRRGFSLHFTAMARLKPCSVELVAALEAARFIEISFGLETGSQTVARRMGKAVRPQDAINTLQFFSGSQIRTFLFLIVGLEGETDQTVIETAEFVQSLQKIKYMPLVDCTGIATVYPNTALCERMVEANKLEKQFWIKEEYVPFFTMEHDESTLRQLHEILCDYVDPRLLFTSPRAVRLQEQFLLPLAKYVAENWNLPDGPRCNRQFLRPFLGLMVETLRYLESSGVLRLHLGDGALLALKKGTLGRPTITRTSGDHNQFLFDYQPITEETLALEIFLTIANSGRADLQRAVSAGLRDMILHAQVRSNVSHRS